MGPIQSSINTALGVAAIASGLTNKKQVEKAQDKLDKSEENLTKTEGKLANTEEDLAKTTAEKDEVIKQQAEDKYNQNIQYGGNTFDVSNDLPTAKATNVDANDKIDVISNNSINPSIASSMKDYLNTNKEVDPYVTEQMMGFRALKMSDSMIAAKREVRERSKRAMIKARKMGGNE